MPIRNTDQLLAGFSPPVNFFKVGRLMEAAGVLSSCFYYAGMPGSGFTNDLPLAGSGITTHVMGQIPFFHPPAGSSIYLSRFSCSTTATGALILADRLWHNSSIAEATTTGQSINSPAWPPRDMYNSSHGSGVMVAIEVSILTSNGSPITNTTLTYTNDQGAGSRTGRITSFPATATLGTFVPFELQDGDTGVQSIQTLTLGTSYGAAACIHLVAYRQLAKLEVNLANGGMNLDAFGLGMPQLYSNTCPFLIWLPTAATAVNIYGQLQYAYG